ncbi:MAG: hemolysin III family protein [Firmicutes bacterium]|nr:hemolysin III family protein [Bacillota bacterium]
MESITNEFEIAAELALDDELDDLNTTPHDINAKPLAKKVSRAQTKGEEIFNGVTHMAGAVFGIFVLVLGVSFAVRYLDTFAVVAMAIYGSSMVLLYTISTIYHMLRQGNAKAVFRVLDHSAIYLLIAGTYTPYTLILLREVGAWGWTIFGLQWGLATLGIILNGVAMENKGVKYFKFTAYLVMGWMAIVAIIPIAQNLAFWGVFWLVAGGVAYTVGVLFYRAGRKTKYIHSVWHIFVLLGSVLQFISIYFFVL